MVSLTVSTSPSPLRSSSNWSAATCPNLHQQTLKSKYFWSDVFSGWPSGLHRRQGGSQWEDRRGQGGLAHEYKMDCLREKGNSKHSPVERALPQKLRRGFCSSRLPLHPAIPNKHHKRLLTSIEMQALSRQGSPAASDLSHETSATGGDANEHLCLFRVIFQAFDETT